MLKIKIFKSKIQMWKWIDSFKIYIMKSSNCYLRIYLSMKHCVVDMYNFFHNTISFLVTCHLWAKIWIMIVYTLLMSIKSPFSWIIYSICNLFPPAYRFFKTLFLTFFVKRHLDYIHLYVDNWPGPPDFYMVPLIW